ncbi:MAG: response regulator transcription factor [Firmicutes bacterium]|nr:response regulator transcription factor [Bacillota bacterium]
MKVLIVDDEELIRNVIKEYLQLNEYEYDEASDGIYAIDKVKNNKYDIIIMDIMMPKMDGYETVKKIREFNQNIPVIMLSARAEEYDKLIGFDLGIDDYVTKPFSPKELIARIKAVTKRNEKKTDKYVFKGLVVDTKSFEVFVDEKQVVLTPKEYELLKYLIENKNIVLSREQLLETIWGYDFYGDDRTIDTHIKTLRSNLGPYRDFIKTIRKVGYKFEYKSN